MLPSPTPEETPTRRMDAPSAPPTPSPSLTPDDATRRMDLRSAPPAPINQNDTATRRIDGSSPTPSSSPSTSPTLAPNGRPLGALSAGTVLCDDCVVVRTHHNHESERPGLFECRSPEGRVMVKVAATEHPPQLDLWQKLPQLNHPNVIRTFGIREEGGRFFEVQEFCAAGTLSDLVPYPGQGRATPPASWIEGVLVPAFHAGLSYLHAQGIVHRDIKPSNLYMREQNGRKTLVIGDFDISSVLQTGRTSRATQRAAGTWIYSPPEAFPRFIDENGLRGGASVLRSSDYYSFGVVIIELLVGTTSLHQAQLPDLFDFYLQGGRVQIPGGIPPRLRELLGGLLCRNRNRRWGGEEVGRWLANQTTEEDRRRIAEDQGFELNRGITPFSAFETMKPTSLAELNEAMAREPRIALDELMSSDVMLNWIGQLDAGVARNIRRDRDKWRSQPRIALLCARLRLAPNAPLPIDQNRRATSAEEWGKLAQVAVAQHSVKAESLCSQGSLLELETWLALKTPPEPEAAARVAQIRATHHTGQNNHVPSPSQGAPRTVVSGSEPHILPPTFPHQGAPKTVVSGAAPLPAQPANAKLILEELSYAFLPQKPFLIGGNVTAVAPADIPGIALVDASAWSERPPQTYMHTFKRWQEGALEAFLRQRLTDGVHTQSPLLQQIERARHDFPDKPFLAFEVVLRLLDPTLAPLHIELDPAATDTVLEVAYGQEVTRAIPYRIVGAGMPFAAVQLQSQWGGLQLETHEITHRQGQIQLRLFSHSDVPVGREYVAYLALGGKTTRLEGERATVRYRVTYPRAYTLKKMVAGAALGGVLLGGLRFGLSPIVSQALRLEHAPLLARDTWPILLGAGVLTFGLAFGAWLWALARCNHG